MRISAIQKLTYVFDYIFGAVFLVIIIQNMAHTLALVISKWATIKICFPSRIIEFKTIHKLRNSSIDRIKINNPLNM